MGRFARQGQSRAWGMVLAFVAGPAVSEAVAPGIGLSWGDGVLSYKGRDYPFTFQASEPSV